MSSIFNTRNHIDAVDGPSDPATERPLKLAVGAVSRAAVDAACDVAAHFGRPIDIVASRGQVGSFPSRPGYAEGWCMSDLVDHLERTGRRSHARVLRDHGGPLQHPEDGSAEELSASLDRACAALAADVEGGADGVHIDLEAWVAAGGPVEQALRRLVEACESAGGGRPLLYEVGVRPQVDHVEPGNEVREQLEVVLGALPPGVRVTFVVVQAGTLVREDRNIGALATARDDAVSRLNEVAANARRAGVTPKAHNCDYLSPWSLRALGDAGFHCNIAPQYAVLQNRILMRMLDLFADGAMRTRVVDHVRESGGWRRWTTDSGPSDNRLMELGAHYTQAAEAIRDDVAAMEQNARKAGLSGFDDLARRSLRQLMLQQATSLEGVGVAC